MLQPPTRAAVELSHLVGPGPGGDVAAPVLTLCLCNLGEAAAAVRLELELGGAHGAALASGRWDGVLGRRARRDLSARVDWSARALVLEGQSFPFAQGAPAAPGATLVARARLDGGGGSGRALEVGLRVPTPAARP